MSLSSELPQPQPDVPTLTRRQALWHITTAALSLTGAAPAVAQPPRPPAPALAEAAQAFMRRLATEKHQRAVFPFESPERLAWHYIPRRRQGLAIKDMSAEERNAAYQLLGTALSESGYRKAVGIMRLEEVLRQRAFFPFSRDPENYAFIVFGAPGAGRPQNDANHIHTIWHDLRSDFGIDALRTHYRPGHRHHG